MNSYFFKQCSVLTRAICFHVLVCGILFTSSVKAGCEGQNTSLSISPQKPDLSAYHHLQNQVKWRTLYSAHHKLLDTRVLQQAAMLNQLIHHTEVPVYGYKVIKTYPHDTQAFTEGLVLEGNYLYESLGLYKQSKLRKIDLLTGKIVKEYSIPKQYFAEGIAIINRLIYQLTFQSKIGFVYDKYSLKLMNVFHYPTQGWGLTTNGKELIMSDGSEILRFFSPNDFKQIRTITVHENNNLIYFSNALHYLNGKIYANIWKTDLIAMISSQDGHIEGWINLKGLNPNPKKLKGQCILNGIAYNPKNKTILVTGKDWPLIYAIKPVLYHGGKDRLSHQMNGSVDIFSDD